MIDDGAIAQPLLTPTASCRSSAGSRSTTSSTALQALTDAVLYLADYRYESSDALASRIIAIVSLRDVLDAFDAEGCRPPRSSNEIVADDIAGLVALQNDDGGWPVWQRSRPSEPYHSDPGDPRPGRRPRRRLRRARRHASTRALERPADHRADLRPRVERGHAGHAAGLRAARPQPRR